MNVLSNYIRYAEGFYFQCRLQNCGKQRLASITIQQVQIKSYSNRRWRCSVMLWRTLGIRDCRVVSNRRRAGLRLCNAGLNRRRHWPWVAVADHSTRNTVTNQSHHAANTNRQYYCVATRRHYCAKTQSKFVPIPLNLT